MADWTTVNPTIIAKLIQPNGADVTVRFTDDSTPTPNTADHIFRGCRDLADLERKSWARAVRLGGGDDIPESGTITIANGQPTALEAAVESMQEAVRRKEALVGRDGNGGYKALMGLTGSDNIGVSSTTIDQAVELLDTTINENVDNLANIIRLLDNWPL